MEIWHKSANFGPPPRKKPKRLESNNIFYSIVCKCPPGMANLLLSEIEFFFFEKNFEKKNEKFLKKFCKKFKIFKKNLKKF